MIDLWSQFLFYQSVFTFVPLPRTATFLYTVLRTVPLCCCAKKNYSLQVTAHATSFEVNIPGSHCLCKYIYSRHNRTEMCAMFM